MDSMDSRHQRRMASLAAHLRPVSEQHQVGAQAALTMAAPAGGKKVAVLGAAGGIGQPLAMLLKLDPRVRELSLYDVVNTPGVGADLSHIDTPAAVRAYVGGEALGEALYGCDLVLIPAGVPRKPGMTRDDLFNINAGIVRTLVQGVARFCPRAWVAVISNPVNSTVPIAAEVLKAAGVLNPAKLFGVTTLDVVRATAFVAQHLGTDPRAVSVPVVGGHAGATILPLLSQAQPPLGADAATLRALTARIQDAGTEVVKAKAGAGSATLSMAYAAYRFAQDCLAAMGGAPVRTIAYVQSAAVPGLPFFAQPLLLGADGVSEALPLGPLSAAEAEGLEAMQAELLASIQKGVNFVAKGT